MPRAYSQLANWRTHWGWDWSVYALVAGEAGHRTLQPALARSTHTGRVGTHALPAFHDETFGGVVMSAAQETGFQLVARDDLPHQLRSHLLAHDELTTMRIVGEDLARRLRFRNRVRAWFERRRRRLGKRLGRSKAGSPPREPSTRG